MKIEVETLRAELARVPGKRRRFDDKLRQKIAEHAQERIDAGESARAIGASLGVAPAVVSRAISPVAAPAERGEIVPVVISKPNPKDNTCGKGIVVRGPCGLVVEGASLDDIAGIVARLSCLG